MFRIICLLIGYAVGLFQTAYIVGRTMGKIDIREHGSGNSGLTNVARVMGAKAGVIVAVCDVLKAVLAYTVCSLIFKGTGTFTAGDGVLLALPGLYGGLGAILGHNFPFYMKFRGGKGIAATLGVILCFDIRVALILYALGIAGVSLSRYISVASLIMTGLLPVLMFLFGFNPETVAIGVVIGGLAYYRHRANISRLIHGKENKFTIKNTLKSK
ncbi:MAG: glycerol-3-phosphate 1-O-acyltransferase PlsY [Clostridiales bacterium]|jgi:glycerol-3-phosphate acyltransferase PlsY|nr:glycerol-3-phosphate 1-O-acyltransferase PlsY [Clostridiales bacterium]